MATKDKISEALFDYYCEDYDNHPGISQSMINCYINEGLGAVKEKFIDKTAKEDKKSYFSFGSLVDCLLTEPEKFESKYLVTNIEETSRTGLVLAAEEYILANYKPGGMFTLDMVIEDAYKVAGIKGFSLDSLKTKLDYNFIEQSVKLRDCGKEIISNTQYEKALKMVTSLRRAPGTKFYSKPKEEYPEYFLVVDQLAIHATAPVGEESAKETVKLKGKIDRLLVDTDKKIIYCIDFKTTSKPLRKFSESYFKYGYDIQALFYRTIVTDTITKKLDLKEYDFVNIIVAVNSINSECMSYYLDITKEEDSINVLGTALTDLHYSIKENNFVDYRAHQLYPGLTVNSVI
jgi:hypothetical protein